MKFRGKFFLHDVAICREPGKLEWTCAVTKRDV